MIAISFLGGYLTSLWPGLSRLLCQVRWFECFLAAIVFLMPWFVIYGVDMPTASVIGIALAGAVIGVFLAPFIGWSCRARGFCIALGMSVLTVAAGTWVTLFFMAVLIAIAND